MYLQSSLEGVQAVRKPEENRAGKSVPELTGNWDEK